MDKFDGFSDDMEFVTKLVEEESVFCLPAKGLSIFTSFFFIWRCPERLLFSLLSIDWRRGVCGREGDRLPRAQTSHQKHSGKLGLPPSILPSHSHPTPTSYSNSELTCRWQINSASLSTAGWSTSTSQHQRSFLAPYARLWNSLPSSVVDVPSVQSFTSNVHHHLINLPPAQNKLTLAWASLRLLVILGSVLF